MANRYGEAALMAVRMNTFGKALTPAERWDDAVSRLYPTFAGRGKRPPRTAFLGLCEAGLVKNIAPFGSADAGRDASSAVQAVHLLKAGTHKTVTELWSAVTADQPRPHAREMDVVLALWKNGLIV